MTQDHYSTLGVGKNASQAEIDKAYRRQSAKHHPDRGGDPATMTLVNVANDCLSDPERREQYDHTGESKLKPPFEREVESSLLQLLSNALDKNGNMVNFCHAAIAASMDGMDAEVRQITMKIAQLVKRRPTVETTDEVNLVHNIIDERIAGLNRRLESIAYAREIVAATKSRLDAYHSNESNPQLQQPQQASQRFTAWGSASDF